ncbi:gamma-glutamyl-gamma-aminobutyrate hydrolase family protein [Glaciimonas soli]|uniref:gamma-glutamyl-gamma-aminobutyrate hydrolase n=1 Tax=Glaciimonas soli TaxID=2590999 RepID=A0A843YWS9_9BURK|nr:gamma-glutamyl-gamma-aminobutyrate hydrolase family protein [Glaciimonas soli]MQR01948.1 gamma-glutamyl-gamma-aminobutyrate hydrolase family protein [Glaciimonas soli]
MHRPIIILPACSHQIGVQPSHAAQSKYVDAVVLGADCAPLILPALGEASDLEAVLSVCHGIMLTGSPSNVHPRHYDQHVLNPTLPQDAARDATTLPLIRAALERGLPLLAICRGFQEINVALGGSLHQAVHDVAGKHDHRENKADTLEQQYAPSHAVVVEAGGRLAQILGGAGELSVNSLHGQGIDRLADGLTVEARAPDGLIEAFSVAAVPGFTMAVQWHPEWRVTNNPASMRLFAAFGQACRDYQAKH